MCKVIKQSFRPSIFQAAEKKFATLFPFWLICMRHEGVNFRKWKQMLNARSHVYIENYLFNTKRTRNLFCIITPEINFFFDMKMTTFFALIIVHYDHLHNIALQFQ